MRSLRQLLLSEIAHTVKSELFGRHGNIGTDANVSAMVLATALVAVVELVMVLATALVAGMHKTSEHLAKATVVTNFTTPWDRATEAVAT